MMKLLPMLIANALSFCLLSQSLPDTAFVATAKKNAIARYSAVIDGHQEYFNGSAYVEPARTDDDSHPFFETDEWQLGSIVFDGQAFDRLMLIYDLTSEKVITETPNGNLLSINREKINSFKINNREFVHLSSEQIEQGLPRESFYELLYDGPSQVLALHTKTRQDEIQGMEVNIRYDERHRYFILHRGKYHPVKSKKSVLSVFSDQKHALKSAMRKNKINFKGNRENALSKSAELYDSLISGK